MLDHIQIQRHVQATIWFFFEIEKFLWVLGENMLMVSKRFVDDGGQRRDENMAYMR